MPHKIIAKIEDHVDPAHKPKDSPKILLPEAEKLDEQGENKESKTN